MNRIFEISGLEELQKYLAAHPDKDLLRERLYAEFLKYSCYRDVAQWNAAVRICECLAIIGWGEHEALEAIRGVYFNGNPDTFFINRDAKCRFFEAVWSRRKDGLAIDFERSFFHGTRECPALSRPDFTTAIGEVCDAKLNSQRNWIPKNPVRIIRGLANCYESSKAVVESLEHELMPALNSSMRPELYGSAVDAIILNLSFSFYDNYHCKTNYIIADDSLKLKKKDFYPKLLEMFSEKEIADNGYYLRNRFTYSPFRKETGTVRVDIVLEKEFSGLSMQAQKQLLGTYLLTALEHVAKRLEPKISYDFQLLLADFKSILGKWWNRLLPTK